MFRSSLSLTPFDFQKNTTSTQGFQLPSRCKKITKYARTKRKKKWANKIQFLIKKVYK